MTRTVPKGVQLSWGAGLACAAAGAGYVLAARRTAAAVPPAAD